MAKRKPRRSAFVPRLLVPAAAMSVVPAVAVASCSSDVVQNSTYPLSVAAVAYPADGAGDADASDSASEAAPDVFFGVAAVAYPAYEAGQG